MDTKLKRISYQSGIKTAAFLLVIIMFALLVTSVISLTRVTRGNGNNSLDELRRVGSEFETLLQMKNEEYIRDGGLLEINKNRYSEEAIGNMIQEQVYTFRQIKTRIDRLEGIYYYATDGELVLANTDMATIDEFKVYEGHVITEDGKYTIYVAYDDEYYFAKQADFEIYKREMQRGLYKISIIVLLGILGLIYLIAAAGRRKNGEFNMMVIDRLWTDANIWLIIATIFIFTVSLSGILNNSILELQPLCAVISMIMCGIGLMFLLSLVRHIKNGTFFRHSFIGFIFIQVVKGIKIIFNIDKLDEARENLKISHANEIKAERMKADLITNVSHDLKTPLTAIINYSDLLIKQDKNNEYAKVIYEKSLKLKELTEGLFEISKAQSGNISINLEKLDVGELINQTLAEFDGHKVDFKVNTRDVSIMADGRLMGRVFENLVGNIIKYSLPKTRAYIDAYSEDNKVYITFKNIANYEMNFEDSEITERFSRGDKARATDGNGLGLAIAQSYVQACGGILSVDVDGDMFKVTLEF